MSLRVKGLTNLKWPVLMILSNKMFYFGTKSNIVQGLKGLTVIQTIIKKYI